MRYTMRHTVVSRASTVIATLRRALACSPSIALLAALLLGACKSAFVEQPSDVVAISGASQTIAANATLALSVNVTGSTDKAVTWTTSDATIASVSANGLSATVVGVKPGGPVTITATLASNTLKRATFSVTVTPGPVARVVVAGLPTLALVPGATATATFSAFDAGNNSITGKTAVWASSAPNVAAVNASSGLVTAVSAGTTSISAMVDGVASTPVAVSVTPPPVVSVSVAVSTASIVAGGTAQATATVRDASGAVLTGRTVTWASGSPSIATVSPLGVVSALAPGTVTITATAEGINSAPVQITVTPVPVATVGVILQPAETMIVGTTGQVLFTVADARGNSLSGRTGVASSSNPSVASIGTGGTILAIAPGTTVITVTVEGVSGTKTLTVTAPAAAPVATIVVTLTPSTIAINGAPSQASAVLRDANGNVLTGRTVAWSSGSSFIAAINATTGVISAVAPGTSIITATAEGRTASATITVANIPVASVEISLTPSLFTNQTAQATVTARDAGGTALSLAGRSVQWASSNNLVATVTNGNTPGIVTAVATGTAIISATVDGRVGQATLTVSVNSCAVSDRTLPFTFTGEITTSDCPFVGLFVDFIRFTTSQTSVVSISASGARDRIWLLPASDVSAQSAFGYAGNGSVSGIFLVPPGATLLAVGAARSVVGPYQLTGGFGLQDVDACRQLYVTGSLTTTQVLNAQSCNATAGRYDDFFLYDPTRSCTITMRASSGFTTNLLTAFSGDGATRLAVGSSVTSPNVSSVLTVSPCTLNGEGVNLRASGVLSGSAVGQGVYTLTVEFQ